MLIMPNWPAPKQIKAVTTTRIGGISTPPFHSFNLAMHVGDDLNDVQKNRNCLINSLNLPSDPAWLNQEHGNIVADISGLTNHQTINADGSYANLNKLLFSVCAVLTADCLPILICNKQGTEIAALHGGWRGLLEGIIQSGISKFQSRPQELLVWLGPAIGPQKYEIGDEVREQFLTKLINSDKAFKQIGDKKYLMNIYQIARQQFNQLGIDKIYGGDLCTYSDEKQFFSHRRDGQTGRQATLIWRQN